MERDKGNAGRTIRLKNESTLTAAPAAFYSQFTARPGDRFGHYRILEEIGQGGCGAVFVAEQQEPVRRRVALKVIKLGMDTRQVIARFEAERQALAMMDHPNIAKVLDAGTTDSGRPFFVMELVRGIRITDYCDQHKMPTAERLKVFIQVCQAVQHAHQKGIIHRDIKPSNILVTLHDGVPVPKVIDFGIAKATADQRLTDKTIYTALEQFIGTPAYMSPEQAEMSGLDIDTRSDIYSLGVLLYELLTGEPPFKSEELLAQGVDAMRRTLREKDPARPSTKLSTMLAADLTALAQQRQCDAPKLVKSVRGDLDWIVMRCLEKDRTRRYETANGLAVDIQSFLNSEPVLARPPTASYRFLKLVRRNKLAFAAAGGTIAALGVGLGFSTWMFLQEREAHRRAVVAEIKAQTAQRNETTLRERAETDEQTAKAEAVKSRQVSEFLKDMLQGVGPSKARGRDTTMLKEILGKTAERVGRDLTNQPLVEAELRSTIGEVYHSLGEFRQAEAMHRRALAIWESVPGTSNATVAACMRNIGKELWKQRRLDEADKMLRRTLEIIRSSVGADSLQAATSLSDLGRVLHLQHRYDEAAGLFREALKIQEKTLGESDPEVALTLKNLCGELTALRNLEEAERLARRAVAIQKSSGRELDLASCLNGLAAVLLAKGQFAEAEELRREVLAITEKFRGHDYVGFELVRLAYVLMAEGKLEEAEAMAREGARVWTKSARTGDTEAQIELEAASQALSRLAVKWSARGERERAEGLRREAISYWANVEDFLQTSAEAGNADAQNELALLLAATSEPDLRDGKRAVKVAQQAVQSSERKNATFLDTLAAAYAEAGDFTNAVSTIREAMSLTADEGSKRAYKERLALYEAHRPFRDPDADFPQIEGPR